MYIIPVGNISKAS